MAVTLLKDLLAIGLKTTAFVQSLFLFPLNALLRAVDRFPLPRRANQPLLPCSTSGSASSSSSKQTHNNDVDEVGRLSDSDMTVTTEPPGQNPSVSNMAATLAKNPSSGKENHPPSKPPQTTDDALLADGISRLEINQPGTTSKEPLTSLKDAVNGAGSIAQDGTGRPTLQNGTSPQQTGPENISSSTPKGMTTTMQLDGETVQIRAKVETPEQAAERAMHSRFMREALDMARLALRTNETPVGCVLVYRERVIAKGMNATNVTRNGTRHAELMAISALLSYSPSSDLEPSTNGTLAKGAAAKPPLGDRTNESQPTETSSWGDVDPSDGHLYPYGQKLHPSPRVDPSVIRECTLYVTVEPCVMCASLLRQLGIKKVYFGAVNDKFGGTGGVFRIHKNSPYSMASAPPSPAPQEGRGIARPAIERRPASTDVVTEEQDTMQEEAESNTGNLAPPFVAPADLPGDGGNIERGFEAEGGWGRDEAVTLLRQFYVQENNRAPVPRKKEGRAARLAAMMERDGHAGGSMVDSGIRPKCSEGSQTSGSDIQDFAAEVSIENTAAEVTTEISAA
ncbi:hypothetical protein C8A03DRAFT_14144 [Achaetomium macrosporum]|uniref:CMP/dCMP-type deaminase domain-containing protein n=1 Tax=Achaetomium macrosporum TaxID=79813 RepID=A0AAN7CCG5_9PEZI|nr:hypothetical protein C8A03DRAFT_14144 [Achaetomium macrosporum]